MIKQKATELVGDGLFRDGSILIVATVIGGGVNYLYQIVMGRMLGPEQYGVFGSLFALSYLLLILSAGVAFISTKYMSELEGGERAGFLRGFGIRVGGTTCALFLILVLLSPILASFLHVSDPLLVMLVGLAMLFGPVNAVNRGALRGLERFFAMGGMQIGVAAVKLLVGVSLVLFGFGVYGAIGAPAVATVLAVLAVTYFLRRWYLGEGSYDGFDGVYRYALPSLLVAFCFTIPTNADVVIVKHLFTSHQAGLYTSVSVFGKVLVFLPAGISSALFPKVAKRQTNGERTQGLLRRALLYTGVLTFGATGLLMAVPELFLGILFGGAYAEAASVLRWYAPAIAAFSLCVVMLNYSLAVDDLRFVKAFTAMTVIEIGLLYLLGATMIHLVAVLFVVNVLAAIVGWLMLKDRGSHEPADVHEDVLVVSSDD